LVGYLPIEDGATPPPVVGDVGWYWLVFREDEHPAPDAMVSMFTARAEPIGDGSPHFLLGTGPDGEGAPVWPTLLHGDGWAATWSAPRPVVGQLESRGTLIGDLRCYSGVGVRGRITRARVVSETIDTTSPVMSNWHPIPSEQRLREVDTAPRWFDHGLLPPSKGLTPGWHSAVPADPHVREIGVLVDLDLDDVPPLPLRPSIVPRALSASGADLWVADERLPLVVRIRDRTEATAYRWPGRILTADEAGGRKLHADPRGCWVTGPDGIRRCDQHTTVHLMSEQRVWQAAANAGILAAVITLEPGNAHSPDALVRVEPSGAVTDVALADHHVTSLVGAGDGGFVMMRRRRWQPDTPQPASDEGWLALLDRAAVLVEGPALDPDTRHSPLPSTLIGADPT
ncbi:MAG: hypothetical protein ACRD0H_28210, partial [Actinomycetes bacterium]